jgi:hypothetical protein
MSYQPKDDLEAKLIASIKQVGAPKKSPREMVIDALDQLDLAADELSQASQALPETSWTGGELEDASVLCKRLFVRIGSIARKELKE